MALIAHVSAGHRGYPVSGRTCGVEAGRKLCEQNIWQNVRACTGKRHFNKCRMITRTSTVAKTPTFGQWKKLNWQNMGSSCNGTQHFKCRMKNSYAEPIQLPRGNISDICTVEEKEQVSVLRTLQPCKFRPRDL